MKRMYVFLVEDSLHPLLKTYGDVVSPGGLMLLKHHMELLSRHDTPVKRRRARTSPANSKVTVRRKTVMTQHVMNILDQTGHTSIGWDADNEHEVAIAKDAFDSAVKKGYHAFNVVKGKEGEAQRGTRMTTFDPDAEKMILVPQLQGG